MKWLTKFDAISWLLLAGMVLLSTVVWDSVPEQVPTHWNAAGEADGFSSREFGLLMTPTLAAGIAGLLTVVLHAAFVKDSPRVWTLFRRVRQGVLGLFAVLHVALVMSALGGEFNVGRVVMTATGVLLLFLATLLPKIPRGRWSSLPMANEATSRRANRVAAFLFAVAGAATIAAALLPPLAQFAIMMCSVIGAGVVSAIASTRPALGTPTDADSPTDTPDEAESSPPAEEPESARPA